MQTCSITYVQKCNCRSESLRVACFSGGSKHQKTIGGLADACPVHPKSISYRFHGGNDTFGFSDKQHAESANHGQARAGPEQRRRV